MDPKEPGLRALQMFTLQKFPKPVKETIEHLYGKKEIKLKLNMKQTENLLQLMQMIQEQQPDG